MLEVAHTHAFAIDRRDLYEGLGAPELWLYEKGAFTLEHHDGTAYRRVERSVMLPALDFELLARFAVRTDQHQALKEWREALREAASRAVREP